jgi:hypothetical protein
MKKPLLLLAALLLVSPFQAVAHHPAADIVDEDIYAMIDAMVADTPHANLILDDNMGDGINTTIIETATVSTAEVLIHEGLLAGISLLDGKVTVVIEFPGDAEMETFATTRSAAAEGEGKDNRKQQKWSEWGGPVRIIIDQPINP